MARKGRTLQDFHREFVVRELACYATPKEAADALNEEFGLTVSPQAMERYDPEKRAGVRMAQKWRDLFKVSREAFLKHMEDRVPEAHKAVRVQHLAMAARVYKSKGNYMAMADLLERIAKETGNVHTNRRELSGPGGKSIDIDVTDYSQMTDNQLRAKLTLLATRLAPVLALPAPEERTEDVGNR